MVDKDVSSFRVEQLRAWKQDHETMIAEEAYNQASGYLRQVLGFIGLTDLDIVLADRARAGDAGETAVEQFGEAVSLAAAA